MTKTLYNLSRKQLMYLLTTDTNELVTNVINNNLIKSEDIKKKFIILNIIYEDDYLRNLSKMTLSGMLAEKQLEQDICDDTKRENKIKLKMLYYNNESFEKIYRNVKKHIEEYKQNIFDLSKTQVISLIKFDVEEHRIILPCDTVLNKMTKDELINLIDFKDAI